jgi:uncharacterized protein (DUF362 family)
MTKRKPIVAILKTSPKTVLKDYEKLLKLLNYKKVFKNKNKKIIIKLNLSWTLYFPACSTQPWQLEGVLKSLQNDGYKNMVAVEDQTVVTHTWKGAYYNKWLPILERYGVEFKPLPNLNWIEYKPKSELLAFPKLFEKILVPEIYFGGYVVHLPTVKTHGHSVTTGAIKNAFGGLIPRYRHHAHKYMHDVLVDLVILQKEIFDDMLNVMDGTVAGDGAGPRTMKPRELNLIIASFDPVAIDALAAKMMGFDPVEIPYLKKAHDLGLGIADIDQIEVVGLNKREVKKMNFHFEVKRSPIIFFDQLLRKGTMRFKRLHNLLFHSPLFKFFILASAVYHDWFWYPTIGKYRIWKFMQTDWGKLWKKYPYGKFPENAWLREWDVY